MNVDTNPKTFISYAHADGQSMIRDFWSSLKEFLKTPQRTWEKWDDKEIKVGQDWNNTILQALENECNCCILLVSDLFGKSSYIIDNEWPKTLMRHEEQGIVFFPVAFGVLEGGLEGLPNGMEYYQIFWPTVSELYSIPPASISDPDKIRLCYKDIMHDPAAKDRYFSRLAIQMNKRFDGFLEKLAQFSKEDAAEPSQPLRQQTDISKFITNASSEDMLAQAMFGSFSYEKRFRDSNSKNQYFNRETDSILDEALHSKRWVLIEGHPLAGKTRSAFEAIKRLMHASESIALWQFKIPKDKSQLLIPPPFPDADYCIVWMDDFDSILRSISKMGFDSNDINLFLKYIADNNLILVATARTGPDYYNLRYRFGLDEYLWDKLESLPIYRLSGKAEREFETWFCDNFKEALPSRFDHNPGSLFIDLEAMQNRWEKMGDVIRDSDLKISEEHAKDILKALYVFYIMESYGAGGIFSEEDIQFYLQKIIKYRQESSPFGRAFAEVQKGGEFDGDKWEGLIKLLSLDKFHLGFIRREKGSLVTETAYLDYIVAPESDRNLVNTIETVFSRKERERLGLLITNYNFVDVFSNKRPKNKKQLEKLIKKLKPLGLIRNLLIWNQLIGICPNYELARETIELAKNEGLKPDYISYIKLIQKTDNSDLIIKIIQEMLDSNIDINTHIYEKLVRSPKDYQSAYSLFIHVEKLGITPTVRVYHELIKKTPDYKTCRSVLDDMEMALKIKPNRFAYERLIQKSPDYKTAHNVLDEMKFVGVLPNQSTYNHVLHKAADYKTAHNVLDEMKIFGIKPNHATYNVLLQKSNDYKTARSILIEMKTMGLKPDQGNYNHLLHRVCDKSDTLEIIEEMQIAGMQLDYAQLSREVAEIITEISLKKEM